MARIMTLLSRLSLPVRWGLLFFLGHSLFFVTFFYGESILGINPEDHFVVILPLLEFWWFLPLSLIIIPMRPVIDFETVFLYSYWSHYSMMIIILVGSFFYGCLGYCVGLTRITTGREDTTGKN